jgi:hypothetical protein
MSGTSPFEAQLVNLINDYFAAVKSPGISYRLKEGHWATQFIDVLVDSKNHAHYLAIECKSISVNKTSKFYFSGWSVDKKGRHQVDRISDFIQKGQRFGILAAQLRQGKGQRNEIYLIPWHHVKAAYDAGVKGIDPADLPGKYPKLEKVDGVLNWDYCIHCLRQL